jgi:hypothetical protein
VRRWDSKSRNRTRIPEFFCDKESVSFAEQAQSILDAAESAASKGETCSEMTILIGQDGAIHMLADSDWPLDSLAVHHGAKSAYRVTGTKGSVRVEARQGGRVCIMQTRNPAQTARLLLGA